MKLPELFRDARTKKAITLLGPAAFGPVCSLCGKHQVDLMPPHHYEVADRLSLKINGKPLVETAAACRCDKP